MNRNPIFPKPNRKTQPTDFFRNWKCSHYGFCLTEASAADLYLDCSACSQKGIKTNEWMHAYGIFSS
jgi:hypothetical protein